MKIVSLAIWSVLLAGCSCSEAPTPREGDGAVTADASARTSDGSAAPADASTSQRDGEGGGGPEVCDGLDNDGNGIIDDVDAAGDGICDCLAVGTLGEPGEWGEGDIFSAWLNARSSYDVVHLGDAEITAEALEPLQVIVAQDMRGREYGDEEVAALEAWVRAGGGLFTLIGYGDPSERANVNRLLAPSGLGYGPDPILAGSPTVPVTTWHAHPVSAEVMRVGVDNGYPVTGGGVVVAEEAGHVLLRALELGDGHVLVWGDEWITYDSEWADHPEYQVERLWLNAFKWLTPENECQVPIII